MTTWEAFFEVFKDRWLKLTPNNRKTSDYVKLTGFSRSTESNVRVLKVNHNFTVGKNKFDPSKIKDKYFTQDDLSYYKLFRNCEFLEDEELIETLNKIELKINLRS